MSIMAASAAIPTKRVPKPIYRERPYFHFIADGSLNARDGLRPLPIRLLFLPFSLYAFSFKWVAGERKASDGDSTVIMKAACWRWVALGLWGSVVADPLMAPPLLTSFLLSLASS
jgi:hypothetical protein